MHSRAADSRSASKCQGKWPDQTLEQAFGLPEVLVAVSTSRLSCKRAGKTRTFMPGWDSSGESHLSPCPHSDVSLPRPSAPTAPQSSEKILKRAEDEPRFQEMRQKAKQEKAVHLILNGPVGLMLDVVSPKLLLACGMGRLSRTRSECVQK